MSPVAPSPAFDALRRSQTGPRDEEALPGRGERHELESSDTRNDAHPTTQNGETDGRTNRRADIGNDGGIDHHQASVNDWRQTLHEDEEELISFVHRFTGRGRWVPWGTSVANVVRSSGAHAPSI